MSGASKRLEARLAQCACGLLGLGQRLAGVELAGILGEGLAHRAHHHQTDVGVYIHLAHPAANATLDLLDRNAIGLLDVTAVLANDREPLLRHA